MFEKLAKGAAILCLTALPAMAQTTPEDDQLPMTVEEAEALYADLRGAYEAGKLCRGIEPTEEDRAELAALLNEKTRGQVMPARQLSMIEAAEREVQRLHRLEGCDGPKMSEFLGMYDAQLSEIF